MSENGNAYATRVNNINNAAGNGSAYSSLMSDQVYNKNGRSGGQNVYAGKSPYENNKNVHQDTQDWSHAPIYGQGGESGSQTKYTLFSDLKILNEQMINLANNMQPDDSPLAVLSQGIIGEIRVLLGKRIWGTSFVPAFILLIIATVLMFNSIGIISIIAIFLYLTVTAGVLFHPAKLFYENGQYKTNKFANEFYEEMDFWFKQGIVNSFVSSTLVSIAIIAIGLNEETIILIVSSNLGEGMLQDYVSTISFSTSMYLLASSNFGMFFLYFKYINKQKEVSEIKRKERSKLIRNETLSRVEQIQADKNE